MPNTTEKGLRVRADGDITGLKKAMADATQVMRVTDRSLQAINKGLKLDPKNVTLLTQKEKILNREIDDTVKSLDELRDIQKKVDDEGADKTTANYTLLVAEIEKCEQKLKDLRKEQDNLHLSSKSYVEQMENLGKNLDTIASKTKGFSAGMGVALGLGIKSAIDYEKEIANIRKVITDLSDDTISNLKMIAVETGTAFEEISNIASLGGTLGIAEQDIDSFTKAMVDLNTATNGAISGEEGAKAVARFLNVLGISTDQASNFGSAITYVGDQFAATAGEILEVATNMSGLATVSGITKDDIIGLAAEMKNLGLQSSSGASAITRTFLAIEKEVATNGDKLDAFVKTSNKSKKQFIQDWKNDAMSGFLDFVNGLAQNEDSAAKLLDEVGLDGVRTAQVLLRLAGNGDVVKEAIAESNKAWSENTALIRKANTIYDTTERKLLGAKEALQQMGAELLESALPLIQELSAHIVKLARWFGELDTSTKNMIVTFVSLGAILSPTTKMTSNLINAYVGLKKASDGAKIGVKASGEVIGKLGNGFSLATTGIGVLSAGLLALTIYTAAQSDETAKLIKANDKLNKSLEDKTKLSQQSYLATQQDIEDSKEFATAIDDLVERLKQRNLTEEERQSIQQEMERYITNLNTALGEEYVAFDEATRKITIQGEEVDKLGDKFDELGLKAKKSAWASAQEENLTQAYKNIQTANENFEKIMNDYISVAGKYDEETRQAMLDAYGRGGALKDVDGFKSSDMVELANATYEYNRQIKANNELLEENTKFVENYSNVINSVDEDSFQSAMSSFFMDEVVSGSLEDNIKLLDENIAKLDALKKLDEADTENKNGWIDESILKTQTFIEELEHAIRKLQEVPTEKDVNIRMHYTTDEIDARLGYIPIGLDTPTPMGSGGYGNLDNITDSIRRTIASSNRLHSGGYGNATFQTTINLTNNGATISQRNIKQASEQIIDMVNEALGRRL